VDTWYGFLDHFLKEQGMPPNYDEMQTNPQFWDEALSAVQDAALSDRVDDAWRFDALISDEAQDFEARWFETARLFLSERPDILWLEDPNQNLRSTQTLQLDEHGFVGYRSLVNFRSPFSIARFIRGALPDFEFTPGNDLPGLGVGVSMYAAADEQPKLVGKLVARLLNQRFKPHDIAIISLKGLASTAFKDLERVGNHTIRRFTGDYDLFGNQVMSKGQVTFDTIRRFKGQQAPAVILVDVDPAPNKLAEGLQLLFCGMTRATVRLELVCNEANDWIGENLTTEGT
jgi:superfamily I DNA and RNA helicase